jgi:hypothetical protein
MWKQIKEKSVDAGIVLLSVIIVYVLTLYYNR